MFRRSLTKLLQRPLLLGPVRHTFQSFSQQDEDDLVRVIKTKPKHVLKHVRQQVWRSRKRELQFRNTVTQLMIVVQEHLRKQLLDPQNASIIMEGVLEECVKFGQHDMAHLLFRAFLRFRKYGCNITIDSLRYLFESYKETDSSELMLQLANEMRSDASLRAFCIAAYLFAGHVEEAEALRASIPFEFITNDDLIAIIEGYAKLRESDRIIDLVNNLPATGQRDYTPIFQSLFRVCNKLDHEQMFAVVFNAATERKATFTAGMFATILRQKMRHVTSGDDIANIERELKEVGYIPDITGNSIVISALARLIHFGDRGSEEVMLAKVDTLLSSIEARLKQGDPDLDISSAHLRAVIRGYGAAGKPDLIKSAWKRMQHKSMVGETRVYNELMKWYALMGNVKDVLEIKDEMCANNVQPDAQTYSWILRALNKYYPRHTEKIYSEIKERNIRPDISLFTTLLGTFGDLGRFDIVDEIRSEVKQREDSGTLQLSPNYYAVLLRVHSHDLTKVEELFAEASTKGLADHPHVQTIVLHSFASTATAEAQQKLELFLSTLPVWTTETYNVLIHMYGKQKNKEKVSELFEKMKSEQVAMNDVTYGTLVTAFARFKDSQRVHEVVEMLKSQEGGVSAHFYSVLAASLNRMGDSVGVNDAWEDLQSSKLFPDTEVYNQFLTLYGKQHNSQKMQTVLDSMLKHVPPNPVTTTTVLDMLGKTGRVYEMETLFEDMKKSQDTLPTSVTYHQVLNAFAKTGDVAKMEKIRDELVVKGFAESAVTFNILADGYGRAKRFEQLNELVARRRAQGIPMDELGYCVLIASYGRAKLSSELLRIAEELKTTEGHSKFITHKVIWSFIDAFCRCQDIPSMELWIQELTSASENGALSASQEMVLLNYYCRTGQMERVDATVSKIEGQKLELTYSALNGIAKGYARAGQFEKTVAVLHKMRDRNFVPDPSTALSLSGSFLRAGLHEQAQQIVEWRRQYSRVAGEEPAET